MEVTKEVENRVDKIVEEYKKWLKLRNWNDDAARALLFLTTRIVILEERIEKLEGENEDSQPKD